MTPLKIRAKHLKKGFPSQENFGNLEVWSRKIRGFAESAPRLFWKWGILGERVSDGGQMSDDSGQVKWGYLRAFRGLVEGLYPFGSASDLGGFLGGLWAKKRGYP